MNNWIVIFVRTGSEQALKNLLEERLPKEDFTPFLPVKESLYRKNGSFLKKEKILFSGYLFIKTTLDAEIIIKKMWLKLKETIRDKDIFYILHYGKNKNDIIMKEKERISWEKLLDSKDCISGSVGLIEGDEVRIIEGPLMGLESKIKKIDRHKCEATVEIEMMGTTRELKLYLEIIEKKR